MVWLDVYCMKVTKIEDGGLVNERFKEIATIKVKKKC